MPVCLLWDKDRFIIRGWETEFVEHFSVSWLVLYTSSSFITDQNLIYSVTEDFFLLFIKIIVKQLQTLSMSQYLWRNVRSDVICSTITNRKNKEKNNWVTLQFVRNGTYVSMLSLLKSMFAEKTKLLFHCEHCWQNALGADLWIKPRYIGWRVEIYIMQLKWGGRLVKCQYSDHI